MNTQIRWFDLLRDIAVVMGLSMLSGVVVVAVYGVGNMRSPNALELSGTLNKVALVAGFLIVGSLGRKPNKARFNHLILTAVGVWILGLTNLLLVPNLTIWTWFLTVWLLPLYMIVGGGLSFFFAPHPGAENPTAPNDESSQQLSDGDSSTRTDAGIGTPEKRRWPEKDMTTKEKTYSAAVLGFACFLLMSIACIALVVIPPLKHPNSIHVMILAICCLAVHVAILLVTAGINIVKKQLMTIPTVLQGIFLCLSVYGIPLAIWGFRLLRRRNASAQES